MPAMRAMLLLIVAAMSVSGCGVSLPGITGATPPGSVLYRDDFASASSGWQRVKHDGGILDYDSGSYRILVSAPDSNLWSTPGRKFGDVRIEVDAGKLAGPDANRIGLICRSDGSSHYFFLISSDGYYGLGIFTDGEAALLGQSAMEESPAIAKGAAPNHLRMDCAGSQLAGYVNGVKVAQAEDGRLKSGEVGILAGDFEEAGADIVFDNFVVLQP
jgi:hypothetical protein